MEILIYTCQLFCMSFNGYDRIPLRNFKIMVRIKFIKKNQIISVYHFRQCYTINNSLSNSYPLKLTVGIKVNHIDHFYKVLHQSNII